MVGLPRSQNRRPSSPQRRASKSFFFSRRNPAQGRPTLAERGMRRSLPAGRCASGVTSRIQCQCWIARRLRDGPMEGANRSNGSEIAVPKLLDIGIVAFKRSDATTMLPPEIARRPSKSDALHPDELDYSGPVTISRVCSTGSGWKIEIGIVKGDARMCWTLIFDDSLTNFLGRDDQVLKLLLSRTSQKGPHRCKIR